MSLTPGKGELQTYWASPKFSSADSVSASSDHSNETSLVSVASTRQLHASLAFKGELDAKRKRCVHWIGEIMIKLLKQIVARRTAAAGLQVGRLMLRQEEDTFSSQFTLAEEQLPIDEVKEVIKLRGFSAKAARRQLDIDKVDVPPFVMEQLELFVLAVSDMYTDLPFHNFAHGKCFFTCFSADFNRWF